MLGSKNYYTDLTETTNAMTSSEFNLCFWLFIEQNSLAIIVFITFSSLLGV